VRARLTLLGQPLPMVEIEIRDEDGKVLGPGELRRRNAIKPIIGHARADGLLERNHLKGVDGDAINAILVAAGHNLRLLLACFAVFLCALFKAWLVPGPVPAG
jgi:hypothetical protein